LCACNCILRILLYCSDSIGAKSHDKKNSGVTVSRLYFTRNNRRHPIA
jgi:hypothetical protein